MGDEELVRAIRRERGITDHEYLSQACAHRDHSNCDLQCSYPHCEKDCLCVCHRWPIPMIREVG